MITNITIQEEDRDSPVAFTINFGGGEEESAEEKNKRMERWLLILFPIFFITVMNIGIIFIVFRFALRSSQRKPRSPRLEPRGAQGGNGKPKVMRTMMMMMMMVEGWPLSRGTIPHLNELM